MNVLKQLFNILSWPVYLCIAGYLLIAAPMLAGYRPVVVLSGSMEPTFPVGSVIYYKAASFEQIQEGDPITFHAGEDGSLVTHRVVEKQELSSDFITQGCEDSLCRILCHLWQDTPGNWEHGRNPGDWDIT